MALAGKDGARARDLLAASQAAGVRVLASIVKSAVERLLKTGTDASKAKTLFNDGERQKLADALASTNATAELLGRGRVRERQEKAEATQGLHKHADEQPFEAFASTPVEPMPPEQALAYFRGLVPKLGVDPEKFGPRHERHALTLAEATDTVLIGKVQKAISNALETGQGNTPAVQEILDAAGVTPKNSQYADMVFRTNAMDAYNVGAQRELQLADTMETFPVWQYLGIKDGRQGADHEPHFDRYYPSSASFDEVRGDRPFNCRCTFAPVDKWQWADLQAAGATAETSW